MDQNQPSPFVCPKTGKIIERIPQTRFAGWLWPVTGLAALVWFGLRVVPKPSRANYPCQRLAAPIAFSFLTWFDKPVRFLGDIQASQRRLAESALPAGCLLLRRRVDRTRVWIN